MSRIRIATGLRTPAVSGTGATLRRAISTRTYQIAETRIAATVSEGRCQPERIVAHAMSVVARLPSSAATQRQRPGTTSRRARHAVATSVVCPEGHEFPYVSYRSWAG